MASKKNGKKSPAIVRFSAKEKKFVTEYIANNGNGTQAAIVAGYAVGSASVTACRMLAKANIHSLIEEGFAAQITANPAVTIQRVNERRARIGFFDPASILDDKGNIDPSKFKKAGPAIKSIREVTKLIPVPGGDPIAGVDRTITFHDIAKFLDPLEESARYAQNHKIKANLMQGIRDGLEHLPEDVDIEGLTQWFTGLVGVMDDPEKFLKFLTDMAHKRELMRAHKAYNVPMDKVQALLASTATTVQKYAIKNPDDYQDWSREWHDKIREVFPYTEEIEIEEAV